MKERLVRNGTHCVICFTLKYGISPFSVNPADQEFQPVFPSFVSGLWWSCCSSLGFSHHLDSFGTFNYLNDYQAVTAFSVTYPTIYRHASHSLNFTLAALQESAEWWRACRTQLDSSKVMTCVMQCGKKPCIFWIEFVISWWRIESDCSVKICNSEEGDPGGLLGRDTVTGNSQQGAGVRSLWKRGKKPNGS